MQISGQNFSLSLTYCTLATYASSVVRCSMIIGMQACSPHRGGCVHIIVLNTGTMEHKYQLLLGQILQGNAKHHLTTKRIGLDGLS